MEIFSRFAKFILVGIIVMFFFGVCVDIGRGFNATAHNNFIAHNAASYVTKFTAQEKDLVDFKQKSITQADAEKALMTYFKASFEDYKDYSFDASRSGAGTIYFTSSDTLNGPLIVRYELSGFDGTESDYGPGVGLIVINIEQKYPSSYRAYLPLGEIDEDNDGFTGYMSAITMRAFTLNTLDSALD